MFIIYDSIRTNNIFKVEIIQRPIQKLNILAFLCNNKFFNYGIEYFNIRAIMFILKNL